MIRHSVPMRLKSFNRVLMLALAAAVAVIATPPAAATGDEPILPPGTDQPFSLRATTPGFTNRYAATASGLGVTIAVTADSSTARKEAATFIARRGLATSECYSFESRTTLGNYLRHSGFRIRLDPNDGTARFAADATFCITSGHTPRGLSYQSFNFPERFLRHYRNQLWIASNGGRLPSDARANWANDTTWFTAAPWAP